MTGVRAAFTAASIALAALTCACTTAGTAPPTAAAGGSGVTAPGFSLPGAADCAGEIARTRKVIANDLSTGHVTRPVHDRFAAELDRAAAACSAGREAEASRMVRATKARFGYS